jgi:DNA-binding beta-propeller fold protein YncE
MRRALALVALLLLLASCAGARRDPFATTAGIAPVWPPPPEPPRVAHVLSIADHRDLFEEGGFGRSLARLVGGPVDSRLVRPYAIAVDAKLGLLVTDPGNQCVHRFDWDSRRYRRIGESLAGGLPSPVGVAVARDGSILVADSRLASVERFSAEGRHLGRFAADHAFRRPAGIAVDGASGEVYVADVLAHQVLVFGAEGALRRTLGGNGSAPGRFNFPTHLGLDGSGGLLVADGMNFRVQRLARDGEALTVYGRVGTARGDFAHPKGVAAWDAETFVAVEGLHDALVLFDGEGRLLMTLGEAGSGPGQFWLPAGLAADRARGLLFVADSFNSRVQVFRLLPAPAVSDPAAEEKGPIP